MLLYLRNPTWRRSPSHFSNAVLLDHPRRHIGLRWSEKSQKIVSIRWPVFEIYGFFTFVVYRYAWKCLFTPIFEFFSGRRFHPLNVSVLSRILLGRKHAFWRIDRQHRSRNETSAGEEESKEEKKKTNSEIWQIAYLPRPPRPPKLSYGLGWSYGS